MRRITLPGSSSLLSLALALLVLPATGPAQPAVAQQPAFEVDKSLTSFKQAVVTSDSDSNLVDLATALLDARADTKISHSTYKKGVRYFQENHPTFYGNFFGEPFYASYDVQYIQLVHARQRAELSINPQNSYWDETSFYCHPLSYDPAFGGVCSGITYAASDFFFLPSPFTAQEAITRAAPLPPISNMPLHSPNGSRDASSTPEDTTRQPAVDERVSDRSDTPTEKSTSPTAVSVPPVPKTVYSSMQETATSLKRTETILRIQREIERRSERRQISYRERMKVARQIAGENGMNDLAQSISRGQSIRAHRENSRLQTPNRLDRDETPRRRRQERTTRPANPGSSESPRHRSRSSDRSRSSERASPGSESPDERSRSRNNSSDS